MIHGIMTRGITIVTITVLIILPGGVEVRHLFITFRHIATIMVGTTPIHTIDGILLTLTLGQMSRQMERVIPDIAGRAVVVGTKGQEEQLPQEVLPQDQLMRGVERFEVAVAFRLIEGLIQRMAERQLRNNLRVEHRQAVKEGARVQAEDHPDNMCT